METDTEMESCLLTVYWGPGGEVLSGSKREDLRTGQREKPANRVVATQTQAICWGALKLGGPVGVVPN